MPCSGLAASTIPNGCVPTFNNQAQGHYSEGTCTPVASAECANDPCAELACPDVHGEAYKCQALACDNDRTACSTDVRTVPNAPEQHPCMHGAAIEHSSGATRAWRWAGTHALWHATYSHVITPRVVCDP